MPPEVLEQPTTAGPVEPPPVLPEGWASTYPVPADTPAEPAIDVGDWAYVLFWRVIDSLHAQIRGGQWETAATTVVSIGRAGTVCHQVTSYSTAIEDAPNPETFLRVTPADRVFRTLAEAEAERKTRPAPK